MTEIIPLTDTARLRVEVDDSAHASCPRGNWSMATGFVKIPLTGDSRRADVPAVHEPPIPIRDAMDHFDFHAAGTANTEDIVARWARIFHGLVLDYDSEHGGFWFVDRASWAEGWDAPADGPTPEEQQRIIADEQETYRQWAEGEVYGVILERRQTYAKLRVTRTPTGGYDETGAEPELIDEWEEVESVWDCYLDDTYTAAVVAMESWNLTEEEIVALHALIPQPRLDPAPWQAVKGGDNGARCGWNVLQGFIQLGIETRFNPRPKYSQNREDYPS